MLTLRKSPHRVLTSVGLTVLAGLCAGLTAVQATPMKKAAHANVAAARYVYVCTKCHEYWAPAVAKKMHYKDSMGHMMVRTAKAPAGYMDGSKSGAM